MTLKVVFDSSGSMSEKKSEIFNIFFLLRNISAEYEINLQMYIWNENIIEFQEPKNLVYGKSLNTNALFNLVTSDEYKILIITDGCFSLSIREEMKKFPNKNIFEYLLVGEDSNVQAVKKITQKNVYRAEDIMACINEIYMGVFQ